MVSKSQKSINNIPDFILPIHLTQCSSLATCSCKRPLQGSLSTSRHVLTYISSCSSLSSMFVFTSTITFLRMIALNMSRLQRRPAERLVQTRFGLQKDTCLAMTILKEIYLIFSARGTGNPLCSMVLPFEFSKMMRDVIWDDLLMIVGRSSFLAGWVTFQTQALIERFQLV